MSFLCLLMQDDENSDIEIFPAQVEIENNAEPLDLSHKSVSSTMKSDENKDIWSDMSDSKLLHDVSVLEQSQEFDELTNSQYVHSVENAEEDYFEEFGVSNS